ncbi:hypothetical protein [Collimonas arenae]|uniref:hypothetical protein n=1 Tax=Collimonas arenae TaxID=279058 RepID=UPI0012E0A2BF|nr:hypothetical protein [Collimonas arenae]
MHAKPVEQANDATTYYQLLSEWEGIVVKKAAVNNWPLHINLKKIAALSLRHWLNDVCVDCGGKGFKPLDLNPRVISDTPCPVCLASGVKPIQCDR